MALIWGASTALAVSVDEATRLFAAGDHQAAADQLREVLAETPNDLGARFWLGRALIELGDLDGAAEQLETVLQAKPESVDSRYWLGEARRRQGRLRAAKELLSAVVRARPDHPLARKSLEMLATELERRQQLLGSALPQWVPETPGRRLALEVRGLELEPGEVDIYSDHVYDYTFSDPPTDWMVAGGVWETTNRWTCSPQWSWFGGFEPDGLAAVWNKRQFRGDITVEVYCAFKMGVQPEAGNYRNPNDMNITICGDGANPSSGYSFIYGGDLNSATRIMRGTQVLAESREPEALLPIFEDGMPGTYDFHRKWWMLRVRKDGDRLEFWVDDRLVAEATDPEPLDAGRVGIWTRDNGLILSRIKIYYEHEQIERDPIPLGHLGTRLVTSIRERHAQLSSSTHPAIYNDFETGLGDIAGRDGVQGAMVTLAAPGADGKGHCAKLINRYAGGSFAASIFPGRFDARKLPRLSFDYRLAPEAKLNFYMTVNGEECELAFSGPRSPAESRLMIGEIPGIRADGAWHRAEFDLEGHLAQALGDPGSLIVSDLFIGSLSSDDYLDAGFGGNHAGTTACIDNLSIGRPAAGAVEVIARSAGEGTVSGWALSIDQDPYGEPPAEVTSEDGEAGFAPTADGVYYVHARPRLDDDGWGNTATLRVSVDTSPPKIVGVEPEGALSGTPVRFHVSDGDGVGVDPHSVRFLVGDTEVAADSEAVSYDPSGPAIELDLAALGLSYPESGEVQVRLAAIADRNGNAIAEPQQWVFVAGPESDTEAPPAPEIVLGGIEPVRDDFEIDTGEWRNWGARGGALLTRDPTTSYSGRYSLKLYNRLNGGSFGAYMRRTAFDAGQYRVVRFAYKIPERLRVDIVLHLRDSRKVIQFTDTDSAYERIGQVPDVIADNRWHVAEFNLYEMLRRSDPTASDYRVQQMVIADTGHTSNALGQAYHIDDFELVPIVSAAEPLEVAWRTRDITGITGVNWSIDRSPTTELGKRVLTDAQSVELMDLGDIDGWLHVRAVDSAGNWSRTAHRRLLVDSDYPIAARHAPPSGARIATSEVVLRLTDPGPAGIDPSSVVLSVAGQKYRTSNGGLTYDARQGLLTWNCERVEPRPVVFGDGAEIAVALESASDFAGNPVRELPTWSWTMDYGMDDDAPEIAQIESSTHRTHLAHTFEGGNEGWTNRGGTEGAKVEVDTSTAASGSASIRLTQQRDGGHMQALVTSNGYPIDGYPVLSFDYRFDPGVKLDLLVQANGQWWPISMTDDPRGAIGRIPGMRADGQWHAVSVDIGVILNRRQRRGPVIVDAIMIGDRNNRDNKAGASANFDNFVIGSIGTVKPIFRWSATDTTGIAGYSYVIDRDPTTEPPAQSMGPTAATSFDGLEEGLWFLHVRALDGAGNWGSTRHYAIMHAG